MAISAEHVSLLVHFRPIEIRAAVERLTLLLAKSTDIEVSLDAGRGNLELSNVRGIDLPSLTDWFYARGARCVFVRYQHEGRNASIAHEAADRGEPRPN